MSGVCRSVCENMVALCSEALTSLGQASSIPDCLALTPLGQPQFPVSQWEWPISLNETIPVNCSVAATATDSNSTVPPVSTSCPAYYSLDPNPSPLLPACLPSCPIPSIWEEEAEAIWGMMSGIGLLGTFFLGPFVLLPHLFTKNKWRWPQQINIWILVCSYAVSKSVVFYHWRS